MNSADMEKLAKMVARETVVETFLTLGLDISNPISVQNQFVFLRNLQNTMREIRNVIIAAVIGATVSGGVYAFWTGFKASAAAPSSAVSTPVALKLQCRLGPEIHNPA
jgi:hypothetical protein